MKVTFALLYLFLCLGPSCFARQPESSAEIINYVHRYLPHHGTLKRSGSFVYVDLDDAYIHGLVPLIDEKGFEEPPYFAWCERAVAVGRHVVGVGAHITAIYPEEIGEEVEIHEIGERITFRPLQCHIVRPPRSGWREAEEACVLVVDAPRLRQIRAKYGLPPELHKQHITIGVRYLSKRPPSL